jgi:hypothetical protein|tara:strand:+ start:1003 stop:1257 length:255 start_codon:yes stop_codon:yes gene_type:complete
MNDEYGFNDQEHFYDMRVYKSEIEKMLDKELSTEDFDKVVESLYVFSFPYLIEDYLKENDKYIDHLLNHKSEQLELTELQQYPK